MSFHPELICHKHKKRLSTETGKGTEDRAFWGCQLGCRYPIVKDIPRFVDSELYASSFGLQWKTFSKTQLDSSTGTTISRDRLARCLGGSIDIVKHKSVLEAGCGAGRFTEVLLEAGAHLFAVDLSNAVEVNHVNHSRYANYFIAQADICELPVEPAQFDIVICLGVVQHTPDPEETITSLCSYVKLGGLLVIDHYSHKYAMTKSRRLLRWIFLRTHPRFSLYASLLLTTLLWPFHRILWILKNFPLFERLVKWLRPRFLRISPVVDYHSAYPQLGPKLLLAWALLDTHDTLTDTYKHLRSAEEISSQLRRCGMVDIDVDYAGNGVEARARKPFSQEVP